MNAAVQKRRKKEFRGGPKHRAQNREANDQAVLTPRRRAEKISIRRLQLAELPADTVKLARFLIGKVVVHDLAAGRLSGRIVETEAYPPGDPAGHHYCGPTRRNRSLFLRHGHCYVYFTYGNHFMLNVSSEGTDVGGGVLIRALEPLDGVATMQRHRKTARLLDLTRGPGRLAAALGSIAAMTAWTFADRALCGLAPSIPPWSILPRPSEQRCVSASPAPSTASTASLRAAIRL